MFDNKRGNQCLSRNKSWNIGLVNFDLFSPFYHKLHSFLKSRFFFKDPKIYNLNFSKSIDVTCRLSLNYHRETVKFQRLKIKLCT